MSARRRIDALKRTQEFRSLSAKSKLWLLSYIQTFITFGQFDSLFATQSAYQCVGENARTFGYQIQGNRKIQAALKVFLNSGKTKRQIQLEEIDKHLAAVKPGSKAAQQFLEMKISLEKKR
jgi:hypothetical protein